MSWMGNSKSGDKIRLRDSNGTYAMELDVPLSLQCWGNSRGAKPAGLGEHQGGRRLGAGTAVAKLVPFHAALPQLKSSSWGRRESYHCFYLALQLFMTVGCWPYTQFGQLPNSASDNPRRMCSGPWCWLPFWLANKITQGETSVYKSQQQCVALLLSQGREGWWQR